MMIITETRVGGNRAKEITDRISFDSATNADTVRYASSIWVLQYTEVMDMTVLASTEQEIHAMIKIHSFPSPWLTAVVYASPRYRERKIIWDNLNQITSLHQLPWLLLDNLNKILTSEDKLREKPINIARAMRFQNCLNSCNMIDLGFRGLRFTWVNKRDLFAFIQESLDRCFVNPPWRTLFPEASVHHLTRLHFDYCPVLLSLNRNPKIC